MRKPVTDIEIIYEQVEVSPEESQQKLNEMFDVLFEETLKYLKEKKAMTKNDNYKIEKVLKGDKNYDEKAKIFSI